MNNVLGKVAIALGAVAFALTFAGQALATPSFDTRITAINGVPLPTPVVLATIEQSDTIRVEIFLTLEPGDEVQSASMPQAFDDDSLVGEVLVLSGPAAGPTTFHRPCADTGDPCPLFPGAAANSGASTPDNQGNGIVGAMGATAFAGNLTVASNPIGVIDFTGGEEGQAMVAPFVQFPGVDGTFSNFGQTAVPFTLGAGVTINVPEPLQASLAGVLALLGLSGFRRRD